MDPQVLMEISQLLQQLPPDKISRMQTLMHNMMAGFDVRQEMEEFEKGLPPGFREKLTSLALKSGAAPFVPGQAAFSGATPVVSEEQQESSSQEPVSAEEMGMREARLTILKAVASGKVSPEDAEKLLFSA